MAFDVLLTGLGMPGPPTQKNPNSAAAFATAGFFGLILLSTHGGVQALVTLLQTAAAASGSDAGGVSIAALITNLSHLK